MRRALAAICLLFLLTALATAISPGSTDANTDARSLLNPHVKPETCESCHTRVPTKEEGAAGNYFLLKESIDATCHLCHRKMCCDFTSLHSFNHKSNFNDWDSKKYKAPKTLPLQNGLITCNTCHFHSELADPDMKMVRLARRTASRIEWVDLCKDCHSDK